MSRPEKYSVVHQTREVRMCRTPCTVSSTIQPLLHNTSIENHGAAISKLNNIFGCESVECVGSSVQFYKHQTQILSKHSCAAYGSMQLLEFPNALSR